MIDDFESFLEKNSIDAEKFAQKDPETWENMKNLFEQIHPASFKAQKKFLINQWRRQYHLQGREFRS